MSTITSIVDTPARRSIAQTCDDIALLLLTAIAIIAALTFDRYGLGWDDYTHAEYAEHLLKLYSSGFTDKSALSFVNLYMYGGGFDMAAALLHKILPLDLFETRRLVGAFVGVAGTALTWRLGRRVGGPVAGLAALILIAVCPAFYGHIFMNPKDIPFAIAMVVLLLGLVRLVDEYPAPSPRTILIVGLGAGLAIGCRVLGGFALVYAAVAFIPLVLEEVRTQGPREAAHRFAHIVYSLIPGLVFGYLVMGLIWPWSIVRLDNPLQALTYFSAFFEKPWKELFNGQMVSVPDMPWSYLPTLFALKLPEAMQVALVAGLGVTVASLFRREVPAKRKVVLSMLALAATLPLMIAMIKRPALYNGIRHFLFVIPPMAVMAGVGFAWIINRVQRQGVPAAVGVGAVFAAAMLLPLAETIRLHPYQYTYFNHLAGTVRGADNLYMLDYWGLALKEASEQLRVQLEERQEVPPANRKWKVAVCGPQRAAQIELGPEFSIGWDSQSADFAMTLGEFYCKGLNAPVLVEIMRDDVVFARVYDIRGSSISSLLTIPAPQ
jgi:hypothetical protein